MDLLKLIAMDEEDLKVLSAHVQDAVLLTKDMLYQPKERRFVIILSRFNWADASDSRISDGSGFERRQAALRFEWVDQAQFKDLALDRPGDAHELLAVDFEPGKAPGGTIKLIFAGGSGVKLHVDCIEAELRDLGPSWKTRMKPRHPDDSSGAAPAS
jgi:Protein of unknown function (DUF2948)